MVTKPGIHGSTRSYVGRREDREIVAVYNALKRERQEEYPFLQETVCLVLVIDSNGNKGIYPVLEKDLRRIDRDGMDPELKLEFNADDMVRDAGLEVPHYICASYERQSHQPAAN